MRGANTDTCRAPSLCQALFPGSRAQAHLVLTAAWEGGSFYHPVFHLGSGPDREEVDSLRLPQLANGRDLSPGLLALGSACSPKAVCQGSQDHFVVCIILIFMVIFFLMIHDSGFPFKGVIHVLFPLKTK